MAGISTKAAGKMDNKNEYQFYELNSDFDIGIYESFYRSQDPQIGRFLQIDPNPIMPMEGLYNSMGNNPISNIDILGDITHYYNTNGDLLRSLDDGKKEATISVIKDDELEKFNSTLDGLDRTQKSLKDSKYAFSDVVKAQLLENYGVKYDTKEFANYFDKHSKDYYEGDNYKSTDGKIVNEHMAGLKLQNGYLRVMDKKGKEDYKYNTPETSYTSEIGDADIHTHTLEGRRFTKGGVPFYVNHGADPFGTYNPNGGKGDLNRRNYERGPEYSYKKGIFDVVVTPTHVYLYRSGQVTIAVERNGVPSKNPGEIKWKQND